MFRLFALQIAFFCDIVASYCNAAVSYCNAAVSYCNAAVSYCNVVRLCHFEAPMARALCYHNRNHFRNDYGKEELSKVRSTRHQD